MKYLGYWIDETAKYNQHFCKRKSMNASLIGTMKSQGLLDTRLSIRVRINMFNAFVRSTLYYGAENYFINETLLREIRRVEGNFIKSLVEMPSRCHTTELMRAMGILEPKLQLDKLKLGFFNRLVTNEYTSSIIKEEIRLNYNGTFISICCKMLNIDSSESSLTLISEKVSEKLSCIERTKSELKKEQTGTVGEIADLLDKNDIISRSKLFNLIKH